MAELPLEEIKVLDFTWSVAGPALTKYLADFGATVILVESKTRHDITRTSGPFKDGIPGINRSMVYALYKSNKYGITLNLVHPQGLEVATRLVSWADIIAENFSPGTMEKMGLGYEKVKEIKPDIIMVRASMQGQTGPHARHPGYGWQLQAFTGITNLLGWPDRGPVQPYGAFTDHIAPRFGLATVLAALDHRRRTGKGQCIDLSQYEASLQLLSPLILDFVVNEREPVRTGNRCPYAAPHGLYPCRGEDKWCAIAIFSDKEWESFCRVIGSPEWTRDPKFATVLGRKQNEDELDELIGEWTKNFTAEEVMEMMQCAGVAAGAVRDDKDINEDPQLESRHFFWSLRHPEIGSYRYDRAAIKLSKTPAQPRMPAPCLGEHNEYVCTQILGMSDEEFVELLQAGVFE